MNGYPGSKGAAGSCQQIISLMPPHRVYVEPFFGGGAVFYAKKPADFSIVADRDADVIRYAARERVANTAYLIADAFKLLPSLKLTAQDLVYLDPPYHHATRTRTNQYAFELQDHHHSALLAMLEDLPCNVILSGYRCEEYDRALVRWRRHDWRAATRGGARTESAWCNFPVPAEFHDTAHVGANFRERERIKRKKARWAARISAMPPAEREALCEACIAARDAARRYNAAAGDDLA